jgi:hypothetical protein
MVASSDYTFVILSEEAKSEDARTQDAVRCLACTLATTHAPLNKAQKKIMTKSASHISSAALSATVLTGPPLPPPGDAARTGAGKRGSGGSP